MSRHFRFLGALVWVFTSAATGTATAGAYEDFFRAIQLDNAAEVRHLVNQGFDPNAPDNTGQVGLYIALRDGAENVAAFLAQHAATDIERRNHADETPLMMATLRGNLSVAKRLLERTAAVNKSGWSPLHYAATGPQTEAVRLLLDKGAELDAPSPNHTTALMMAARYGTEASVELLLSRGASKSLRNDQGLNAEAFANLAGRSSLAARLTPANR